MKSILQVGSPFLEKKSKKVDVKNIAAYTGIIKNLVAVCKGNPDSTAGISAPQIGENIEIMIARRIDIEDKYEKKKLPADVLKNIWEIIINPEILAKSSEKTIFWEGCLSVGKGENRLFGPVERPSKIEFEYYSPQGDKKKLKASGYFAHVVQHEIDHLNGILFIAHVKNPVNLWKSKDLDTYLNQHGEFPEIL
jgi:peptide deformylase